MLFCCYPKPKKLESMSEASSEESFINAYLGHATEYKLTF